MPWAHANLRAIARRRDPDGLDRAIPLRSRRCLQDEGQALHSISIPASSYDRDDRPRTATATAASDALRFPRLAAKDRGRGPTARGLAR